MNRCAFCETDLGKGSLPGVNDKSYCSNSCWEGYTRMMTGQNTGRLYAKMDELEQKHKKPTVSMNDEILNVWMDEINDQVNSAITMMRENMARIDELQRQNTEIDSRYYGLLAAVVTTEKKLDL
jgi:hypothetical protein